MLTITQIQQMNAGNLVSYERAEISFADLKKKIILKLREALLATGLSDDEFRRTTKNIVQDYVYSARPYCVGYVKDGKLLSETLITDLVNSITSWGNLTVFLEDNNMRELQINGPVIFVDGIDGYSLLRDPRTGEVIKFDTPEESFEFFQSLLNFSGERMTVEKPLCNASTIQGYRLACIHPCVYPPHPSAPNLRWPVGVIRKLGGIRFTEEMLVSRNTAAPAMLLWIAITFEALEGHMIVGTTGCGKTSILEYGMLHIKDRNRAICIQAPTEYNYQHIIDGIMHNNAVYLEVNPEADKDSERSATLDNLVSQTLRMTAELLMIGELKDSSNFGSDARAKNAGTRTCGTLHTFTIDGAIDRYALELVNALGMDYEIAKEMACTYLGPITLCDRLGDGSRKIMGCAEALDYDRTTGKYMINYLFEFVLINTVNRSGEEGEAGMVWNIGFFVKRGNPSAATLSRLLKRMPLDRLKPLLDIPIGTILQEVNYKYLPEGSTIMIDDNIIIPKDSPYKSMYKHRKREDREGILIGRGAVNV